MGCTVILGGDELSEIQKPEIIVFFTIELFGMSPTVVSNASQIEVNEQAQEASPNNVIYTNETRRMSHCGMLGTYTGDFVNGKRHGQGVFKYNKIYNNQTEDVYSGGWVDDALNGRGTMVDFRGNTITGTFRNNILEGLASKRINGTGGDHVLHCLINRFDGEFNDQNYNIKSGVGTFVNGWTFHCDYDEKGKPHGKGCVKNCVGKVLFESEWKNGICDCGWFDFSSFFPKACIVLTFLGIFVVVGLLMLLVCYWSFGMIGSYTGQVGPSNLGVATIKGQGVFNGSWENGLRHGHGVMKWEDPETAKRGDVFVGEWRKGQMASGVYTYLSGKVYTGDFVDNMYHGYGVLNYTDGSSYTGHFNKNWREGNGTLTEHHGRKVCKGLWMNDKPHVFFYCVDYRQPAEIFKGIINSDGMKVSGQELHIIHPNIYTILTVYKDEKVISVRATLFSVLTFPTYSYEIAIALWLVICMSFCCGIPALLIAPFVK